MARTITVKGIGKVSAKPDYVVFSMTLESKHKDYDKAMDMAADHIQQLNETLCGIGFEKGSVKTTNFSVRTDYDRVKDRSGNYQSIFRGYEVTHNLKLAFDFDMGRLSQALSAIAGCLSHPQLSVAFTVKDATAINEEMLRSATTNAKKKAEILCEASGVTMGDLIAIDYNWGELDIYSHTRYDCCEDAMPLMEKSIDMAIQSAIDGRLSRMEDYIARSSFTRNVEQDMTNGIIAEAFRMDEDSLKRIRAQSVRNVRSTNGITSLEKYARSRQEQDWDDDEWQD